MARDEHRRTAPRWRRSGLAGQRRPIGFEAWVGTFDWALIGNGIDGRICGRRVGRSGGG